MTRGYHVDKPRNLAESVTVSEALAGCRTNRLCSARTQPKARTLWVNTEIGGQIPRGCQSTPKAKCLFPAGQRLDSPLSLEPTKPANRTAVVLLANLGVIDSDQTSDTHYGPRPLCSKAGRDSIARNWTHLARSRMEIEILILDFGKRRGIAFIIGLTMIQQGG